MSIADAASECLIKLAVDDDFRKKYMGAADPAARTVLLEKTFGDAFRELDADVQKALSNVSPGDLNLHIFDNQQTSQIAARSLVRALDSFLATLESEMKKPK
jgi:hypothetical protein